ncbi:MAG: hypothetical protein H6636_09990 [Anaerolineales bacterium]|nr:hypothetical protein [Anaerolineales bacterium]
MSRFNLNAIATKALLDHKFQADILNGHRKERLNEFDLSDDEKRVVLSIEAKNVDQFVTRLGNWMYAIEGP